MIFKKKTKKNADTRFELNSGERQVGTSIENIRFDHVLRYDLVSDFFKKNKHLYHFNLGFDIFCGNGYGTSLISNSLECSMIGIDASSEAVDSANLNYSNSLTFFASKEFPFKLPENVSDFIVCFESVEHIKRYDLLLEELYGNLKKGGFLFLSTPNEKLLPFIASRHPFHIRHFYFTEIVDIVKSSGKYELVTWYGQNMYSMTEDGKWGNLSPAEMNVVRKEERQILIFIFRKVE